MELKYKAPRGTQDLLPQTQQRFDFIQNAMLETSGYYGYRRMSTPVFEQTELFDRSVGETTDVVQKEMYTFNDNGGRSVTLRPEGTAGAVRAFLEHGLFNEPMPQKLCYTTTCYRYEKPQAGRLREFHQFGVECFGAASPYADAELIELGWDIFDYFGLEDIELRINSIGCPKCRAKYQQALKEYFTKYKSELCDTCLTRLERNPMRILDCKSPVCSRIAEGAPSILDYLCGECSEHFEKVRSLLDDQNIDYVVDPGIVRGLDYYTRTVFEFVSTKIGAQGTVCGGGRYDGLVEELGGPKTPALGFAIGIERFSLLLEASEIELPPALKTDIVLISADETARDVAAALARDLRQGGNSCEYDTIGRSVKAQMKYADKIGALYTAVIGSNELESGVVKVKNMSDGTTTEIELDGFAEGFMEKSLSDAMGQITPEIGDDVDLTALNELFGIN